MALKITLFESLKDPPLASPIRLLSSKSGSSLRAGPNCCPVWSGQKTPPTAATTTWCKRQQGKSELVASSIYGWTFLKFLCWCSKAVIPYIAIHGAGSFEAAACRDLSLQENWCLHSSQVPSAHHAKHSAQQGGPGANFYFWTQMIYSWIVRSVL